MNVVTGLVEGGYNLASGIVEIQVGAALYGLRTGISIVQKIVSKPAEVISKVSGPIVGAAGYLLKNSPELASAAGFGYLTYLGAKKIKAIIPFTQEAKWIDVENRFKAKPELKVKPINLTELVNKDAIAAMASQHTDQFKTLADEKKKAATEARKLADEASRKAAYEKNRIESLIFDKKSEFQLAVEQGDSNAIYLKNDLEEARKELDYLEKISTEAEKLEKQASEAEKASKEASEKLENIKKLSESKEKTSEPKKDKKDDSSKNVEKERKDPSNSLMTNISNGVKTLGGAYKGFMDPEKEKKDTPEANFIPTYSIEMSKPKPGEIQIIIPFSEEAVVLRHKEIKDCLIDAATGTTMAGIGILGFLDVTGLDDLVLSSWLWRGTADMIGTPVHMASKVLSVVAGWATRNDSFGLGKLVTAGALCAAGGYAFSKTNLVWFNIKKNPHAPSFNDKAFMKDFVKLSLSATLITAGVFKFADFVQGT